MYRQTSVHAVLIKENNAVNYLDTNKEFKDPLLSLTLHCAK